MSLSLNIYDNLQI